MARLLNRQGKRTADAAAAAADDAATPSSGEGGAFAGEPAPAPGPDLLYDGPLLVGWFMQHQLERELDRARRHGRHLSIVVLTPVPSLGDKPSAESLAAAASAASRSSRGTDLVGWLGGNRILLVLPETDRDGAAAAIYRLTAEMAARSLATGQLRWVVTARIDGHQYATADELLAAAAADVI